MNLINKSIKDKYTQQQLIKKEENLFALKELVLSAKENPEFAVEMYWLTK